MLTLMIPPAESRAGAAGAPLSEPTPVLRAPTGAAWLLDEAIRLAERFGRRVVEAELEDGEAGVRWTVTGQRLWLDLRDPPETRLAAIADALRGEPGLAFADMSPELADYLAPRWAA